MVVSTVWFVTFLRDSGIHVNVPATLPAIGVALVGLLMVSPIPYRSNKDLPKFGGYRSIVIAVVVFTALIAKPQISFFIVGVLYVTSGPFELFYRYRTGKLLEPAAPGEPTPASQRHDSSTNDPLDGPLSAASPAQLLDHLAWRGFEVWVEGDDLVVEGDDDVDADLADAIRANKLAMIAILDGSPLDDSSKRA